MLRTDLIDLINDGRMWAFVGSGVSTDAGCPSWGGLVESSLRTFDEEARQKILNDERYKKAFSQRRFAQCFSRIEATVGRDSLEKGVVSQLNSVKSPGKILRTLADWPLAGYITTNYDQLLQKGLQEKGEHAWLSIGNAKDEVRKISGEAKKLIWHIHGSTILEAPKSHLVLTEKDYDDLYLESSPMVVQLKGLLAQRRVVFIGFGFEDYEVMRLLKLVGLLCNPARPAFAFLSGLSSSEHESERLDLLEKYNVDVIPYRTFNGSHEQLLQLLEAYGALILRRSQRFGQPERECPTYDPETTGLMVYNQLVMRQQGQLTERAVGSLLKARILSLLKFRGPCSVASLVADLSERFRLIQGVGRLASAQQSELAFMNECLDGLVADGLIETSGERTVDSVVALSKIGLEYIDDQAAKATRLSEQFSSCLVDRARESFPDDVEPAGRVARASECFLKDCIRRRALGVAMAWYSPRMEFKQYHIVGLLQALPEFLQQVANFQEGLALVRLIKEVLSRPSEAEIKYLSICLQAQFGVNLLGYDRDTIKARTQEIANTLFLIDSSTLIPLLARSSYGYQAANLLLRELKVVGSMIATTQLLSTEVAEHARWAMEHISNFKGPLTPQVLALSTGRAGARANAFLEGFLEEASLGKTSLNFGSYLDSVCGHPSGHTGTDEVFALAMLKMGVPCLNLNEWQGFSQELWDERDQLQEQIARKRKGTSPPTYKHERQVKAEAEGLIIIRNLRKKSFEFDRKQVKDAYFISNTRAIDEVAGPGLPITMRPHAMIQWLSTITACPPEEMGCLFDGLLGELSERGFAIVDRARMQNVFSPLVVASREKFNEEIETHRLLIANRFGEDPSKAFREVDDLEVPVFVHSYYIQKASYLEQQLQEEKKSRKVLESEQKLTVKERKEYEILKAERKERKKKALSKKRSTASRPGKKRRK
jgi:hypothetical protein